jgi:hypothetical protein
MESAIEKRQRTANDDKPIERSLLNEVNKMNESE